MILKNRIVATPTGDDFEEKALGGAALVIAGHAIVEPGRSSFASPEEPYPFAKYEREATRKKVLKIHKGGAYASIDLCSVEISKKELWKRKKQIRNHSTARMEWK